MAKWFISVASCCLALGAYSARGCDYNVREVGFIDTGIEPYRLIVYLPEKTPAEDVAGLKKAMEVPLVETNIRFVPVVAGADANHPALELARTHGITRFPAAVLLSPDGQSMPLALPENETSLGKAVPAALESVLASPVRRQMLEKAADTYAVVLLVEGPEAQANATAKEAVTAAIGNIKDQLEYLPKPIKNPPEMVVVDQKSLAREQVLLWTLRLKPEDVNRPHAAVFYGRGRWIGPLFDGAVLTADNLTQLLAIIGGDCECGLDYRWVQGTMLPLRWEEGLQQKVVASLGFDPENPMIKMEMISIVRRGMGGFDEGDLPIDYREVEVGNEAGGPGAKTLEEGAPQPGVPALEASSTSTSADETVPVQTVTPVGGPQPHAAVATAQPRPAPAPNEAAPSVTESTPRPAVVGKVLAVSLGGMAILVGLVSLAIALRARNPWRN